MALSLSEHFRGPDTPSKTARAPNGTNHNQRNHSMEIKCSDPKTIILQRVNRPHSLYEQIKHRQTQSESRWRLPSSSRIVPSWTFTSVTYGNKKGADLYAIGESRKAAVIKVKASQSSRFVSSLYQKYKSANMQAPDFWVLYSVKPTDMGFFQTVLQRRRIAMTDYFTSASDAPGRISAKTGIIPPSLIIRTTNAISTAGNIVLICLVWAK